MTKGRPRVSDVWIIREVYRRERQDTVDISEFERRIKREGMIRGSRCTAVFRVRETKQGHGYHERTDME